MAHLLKIKILKKQKLENMAAKLTQMFQTIRFQRKITITLALLVLL